jgi:hypothetical protein
MKQLTEYNRVSGYLNKIFNRLNETYFENALTKPVITIMSTPRAYGHVSVYEVWLSEEKGRRELNIGAGTLNRPIENVVATMLHEMVHIYCMENGIKDTSRGGSYHNKRFKEEAERRDLIISYDSRIGFSITQPSDKLIEWCIDEELEEIKVHRLDFYGCLHPVNGGYKAPAGGNLPTPPPRRKPSSTRKYICPKCGMSVRATKTVNIACIDCGNVKMIEVERI